MATPIGRVRPEAAARRRGLGCRALARHRSSAARRPRHPPGAPRLAAVSRALKTARTEPPPSKGHYLQKLWTTLWTAAVAPRRLRGQIAFLLPWSKNEQPFLA